MPEGKGAPGEVWRHKRTGVMLLVTGIDRLCSRSYRTDETVNLRTRAEFIEPLTVATLRLIADYQYNALEETPKETLHA